MRPSRERIDFSVYLRAFGVFARNPTVIILPLLVGVIGILIGMVGFGDGMLGSFTIFLLQVLQLFAFGVAIIIGDQGWRRGSASFDDAWQDARRKGRDLLFAAFGYTFVLSIVQYAGTILGSTIGLILVAIATYGLVYTMAAAAIGGVPGGGAISVSIERVRSAPLAAALLTAVNLILIVYAGRFIDGLIFSSLGITSALLSEVLQAVVAAILTGYVAVVTAKVYSDISFTMPRW